MNENRKESPRPEPEIPTKLPQLPVPRDNDNKDFLGKFNQSRWEGRHPACFDVDTHH
jgi:hypothetical protein